MPKASLVSIVEDDRFFRESMRRLMKSLGYRVEVFPSAAAFLRSPRLAKTAAASLGNKEPNEIEVLWPGLAPRIRWQSSFRVTA